MTICYNGILYLFEEMRVGTDTRNTNYHKTFEEASMTTLMFKQKSLMI